MIGMVNIVILTILHKTAYRLSALTIKILMIIITTHISGVGELVLALYVTE